MRVIGLLMAASIQVRTLFLQLLLMPGTLGMRDEVGTDFFLESGAGGGSFTICDDEDIWIKVSSPTSIEGIRGIDWKSIQETVEDFLEDQQTFIDTAVPSIQRLQEAIRAKEGRVAPRIISKDEIENLVLKAVSDEDAFGHLDAAKETMCGKPGHTYQDRKLHVEAFSNSVTAMTSASNKFFTSEIKTTQTMFMTLCEDFLGFQRTGNAREDDMASYCDELCAEMARAAQVVSDARVTAGQSEVVKLRQQLAKLEEDKRKRELDQEACRKEWNRLELFKNHMEQLQGEIAVKYKVVMKAEWALHDASTIMEETVARLEAQQAAVVKVVEGLTPLAEAASDAKKNFETVNSLQTEVTDQLKSAKDELDRFTNDLEKIRQIDGFATNVKRRLGVMLLKIDGHNEMAMREPLRKFGITEDYDAFAAETGFYREVMSTDGYYNVKGSLTELHKTCEKALVSFESLKPHVDLTPLCELPKKDESAKQMGKAVQTKSDHIADRMMAIQTWLSPYKGNTVKVTPEIEMKKYIGGGEPLGLRRVFGAQSQIRFQKYLVHWKLNGKFLKLVESLSKVIGDLDMKIKAVEEKIGKLMDDLFQAEQQLTEAVSYLESTEIAAKAEKDTAEGEVELLQNAIGDAENTLEDLKKKLQEAIDQWRDAKNVLLSSHAEHTKESLLEIEPELGAMISSHDAKGQL